MTTIHPARRYRLTIAYAIVMTPVVFGCAHAPEMADEPAWTLTFSDEFDGPDIDTDKWEVLTRAYSHNEEKQYYLPEQASIVDGMLRITSTDKPYEDKPYRSARLESWYTQAYGRFEARAKVPTTQGIWPAFWLLPRSGNWPHDGEIDIMEHAGSDATKVSCAFHFSNDDGQHAHVYQAYRATDNDGSPVRFPDGFHVYAVEWTPHELVFLVDDVEFYRVSRDDVPVPHTPMAVILNTAVGGWFDGDPDETTVFPQHFDIDWVRVYQRDGGYPDPPGVEDRPGLVNGDFERGREGWVLYSNAMTQLHNLEETRKSIAFEGEGGRSLKVYGKFGGIKDSAAIQERILAEPGETYTASAVVRTNADDPVTGTGNHFEMFIRFVDAAGEPIADSEGREVIADADTPTDQWLPCKVTATAPDNAATLHVGFEFRQSGFEPGAVWVDQVTLETAD